MKKKILKFIGWFFGIILGIAFAIFLAFQLSPQTWSILDQPYVFKYCSNH